MKQLNIILIIISIILVILLYYGFNYLSDLPRRQLDPAIAEATILDNTDVHSEGTIAGVKKPKYIKDCYLVIEQNDKLISLYEIIKSEEDKTPDIKKLKTDFDLLRLYCFQYHAGSKKHLLHLQDVGISAVQYTFLKGKLKAVGILVDGSKMPLMIAPKKSIPKQINFPSIK